MKDTFGYSYLNKNDLPNQIQQVVFYLYEMSLEFKYYFTPNSALLIQHS